ncbi:hypothetical protein ACOME3_010471 [Neoechinorhynchus agilis]
MSSNNNNRYNGSNRRYRGGRWPNRGRYQRNQGQRGNDAEPQRQYNEESKIINMSIDESHKFIGLIAKEVMSIHTFKPNDFECFEINTLRQECSVETRPKNVYCTKIKLNKSMKMMINYFPLTNSTPFRVKQYDVKIEDKDIGLVVNNPNGENVLSSLKQRIIIKKAILKMANDRESEFKYRTVYNGGRVVYSLSDFATGSDECSILVSEKYLVIFKKTNEIDMEQDIALIRNMIGKSVALRPQMAIIDIVFKFALSNLLINFGRSFFPLNDPPAHRLDSFKGLFNGIFASAVIAFDALALNVDVANAVIAPEISLLDFLRKKGISEDDLTASKTNPQLLQSVSELLKDRTKIIVKYDSEGKHKRYATFNSFKMESPFEYKFVLNNDDGHSNISVGQFFKQHYGHDCLPHFVTVATGKRGNAVVPLELVYLAARKVQNEELKNQMADVIKRTTLSPTQRKFNIDSKLMYLQSNKNNECAKYFKEWRLEVSDRMAVVDAGLLPIPMIYHSQGQITYQRHHGAWNAGKEFSFFKGVGKDLTWSYYIFPDNLSIDEDSVQQFLKRLIETARRYGIDLTENGHRHMWHRDEFNVQFPRYILSGNTTKVTFFFARRNNYQYSAVKAAAELVSGSITQFITDKAIKRRDRSGNPDGQVIANICNKLCAKLGGVNVSLTRNPVPFKFNPQIGNYGRTMFVGLDVTHRVLNSQGHLSRVSIAAVVASVDFVPHSYVTEISLQKNPQASKSSIEIVYNLETIMRRILGKYRERNKCLPDRILLYRDGVSDTQLDLVNRFEVNGIIEACRKEGMGDEIKLSVVVVQKRHHLRMFPSDRRDGDRNGNPLPGTVYSPEVCMDSIVDAFLVSHAGIQGTSRPTRYRLIYDSIGFNENNLMQLCDPTVRDYFYEDDLVVKNGDEKVSHEVKPTEKKLKFLILSLSDRLSGLLYFC